MGKIYLLSTGLLALLLTACNPRVMTDIMISHDPLPADSVHVFDVGETAPNSAEAIGKVAVVDAGFTTRCKYDQILQLAKEETGQAGGNGLLLITHLKPSFWGSSCHQIEGMMLLLHDMNIDSLSPNPVMRGVETMEAIRKEKERKQRVPKHTIMISGGVGWLNSDIETPIGTYKKKGGTDWRIEYHYVSKSYLGFGLTYAGFYTSFPVGDMNLTYIGPSLVLCPKLGERWILRGGISLGYCHFSDGYEQQSGFGGDFSLGIEHMLSRRIGIAIEAANNIQSYSAPEGYQLDDDENYGINRTSILGGLRFYF